MIRRHARPMTGHERARLARGAAYRGGEAVAYVAVLLLVVFGLALAGGSPSPTP